MQAHCANCNTVFDIDPHASGYVAEVAGNFLCSQKCLAEFKRKIIENDHTEQFFFPFDEILDYHN